jgi:hypothetical protein
MNLFKEIKEQRCILFGMKLTKSEGEWLRTKALKAGVSKSSFVRRLLAELARKEGHIVARKER